MAEGFLKSFSDYIEVYSAGTNPSVEVHPKAIEVMKEIGIDISKSKPESVDTYIKKSFDYVITVCGDAKETCPVFEGKVKNQLHIGFDDPADATGTEAEILSVFKHVRNEILVDFFAFYQTELR